MTAGWASLVIVAAWYALDRLWTWWRSERCNDGEDN